MSEMFVHLVLTNKDSNIWPTLMVLAFGSAN